MHQYCQRKGQRIQTACSDFVPSGGGSLINVFYFDKLPDLFPGGSTAVLRAAPEDQNVLAAYSQLLFLYVMECKVRTSHFCIHGSDISLCASDREGTFSC